MTQALTQEQKDFRRKIRTLELKRKHKLDYVAVLRERANVLNDKANQLSKEAEEIRKELVEIHVEKEMEDLDEV